MVHEMKATPVSYRFPVNGRKPVNTVSHPPYIIGRETGNRETVRRSVFGVFPDPCKRFAKGVRR